MKLYLGCALPPFHEQHYEMFPDLDEFVWVDKYVDHPKIKKWDACELPVEDESVEVIYASHLLEHIEQVRVREVLNHWKSKLKSGGQIVINVPDLAWCAKEIIKYDHDYLLQGTFNTFDGERGLMAIVYGTQAHDGEYHKSGFTRKYLEGLGFSVEQKIDAHEMGVLIGRFVK